MSRRRDPAGNRGEGVRNLQDVVEWEPESRIDRLIYRLYLLVVPTARGLLVAVALLILLAQFALGGLGALADPVVGAVVVLSALPALVLVGYIRYADVTPPEPLRLLVGTFALGLLFAGFAGLLNELLSQPAASALIDFGVSPAVALAFVFILIVAPVEESVKLLAVRLYPFSKPGFNAVISGAVYGAAAGFGFATIENAIYITQFADTAGTVTDALAQSSSIATQRALAGPGHVIYSAFAGYYLGLAKFNGQYAGPIVFKGLLVASVLHGSYNVLVSHAPDVLTALLGFSEFASLLTFVIAYNGVFTLVLIRKLSIYRAAYRRARRSESRIQSERTEFE